FGHFELDREINNLPLAKPARKHTNSGIENARVTKHRREARRTAHWRHTIKLEASQPHADHFRFVVETKTAVCLVAIPLLLRLPLTVPMAPLFRGDDLAAHPR